MTVEGDIRSRILSAAAESLRRFTLSKMTMEDVARAAGLSRQTVYRHVGNRDDLLIALFVQQIAEHQHSALREIASRSPVSSATITDLLLAELHLASTFPLFKEVLDPSIAPRMAELVFGSRDMSAINEQFWVPLLDEYQKQGIVRADLDLVAATRWIIYQQFWLLTHPGTLCPPEELPRYVDEFITAALVPRS